MPKIHFERFDNLLKFLPKSKIKAGDGQENGKYLFFTSSATLSKFIDTFNYEDESLIFGSGGNASIHYCNQMFATSTDCFVVNKDSEDIDIKYVYYYLKSNIRILEDGFKGAGLKHISKKYISEIKIPLLPLEDQQKIAQLFTQTEELINKREESIKLLDELTKSTFLDMFESILTNKNPENLLSFEQMAVIDTNMTTDFEKYANFPHIGIASIEKDTGKILDYKLVKDDNLISGKYTFDERHILYSKIRPNLNKVALPNFKGLLSADGYPILPKDNMNRIFLANLLRTNFFLNYILGHCDRANIPKVNQKQLSGFCCNIPDKALQDKFAEIVIQIEQTKTFYQNSLTELNNLFGSIAQKAFKGEFDVSKIELMQKDALSIIHNNAEDRLMSKEKEFISRMDKIIGNKSGTELTIDDEEKAVALSLGYKFGFYDDESIEIISSKDFLDRCNDEAEAINAIYEKHSNPNILIDGLINLISEKEQSLRVRYVSSEILASYDVLNDKLIVRLIDVIYNEEEIEEEIRLHIAYAFTEKIDIYPKIYDAIYWILRKQSTSVLSNKEIFIHFLKKEFEEKKESLAFDTLVKNIAYYSRKMTAYKMFLFDLLKYDIDGEQLDKYDYKALKDDIFRLIKEKRIIQKLNPSTYEINLFWNFDELEEK